MITPPPKPSNPDKKPPANPIKGKATQRIFSTLTYCPPENYLGEASKTPKSPQSRARDARRTPGRSFNRPSPKSFLSIYSFYLANSRKQISVMGKGTDG